MMHRFLLFSNEWAGAITIPRELLLNENNQLVMTPFEELKRLRGEHQTFLRTSISENIRLEHIKGECHEIIAEFSLKGCTAQKFGLNIRCSEDSAEKTTIYYDLDSGKIAIDRNQSGKGEGGIIRSKIHDQECDFLKLHLFKDRSSLELFINDGETVMTSRIYPDPSSVYVHLFAVEGEVRLLNLDAWELADIWE